MIKVSDYAFERVSDGKKLRYRPELSSYAFGHVVLPYWKDFCVRMLLKRMFSRCGWGGRVLPQGASGALLYYRIYVVPLLCCSLTEIISISYAASGPVQVS